jgi:lysophospholipase L1-like esterase
MRALRPLIVVLAGLALALPTRAATAEAPEPAVYLALGDSVAAGVGAEPRAENGYVPVLYDTLTAARHCGGGQARGCRLDLVNLAVPGATTTTLIQTQLPAAVELLEARAATRTPVDDVRLVTLDIGGNDVFGPVIAACSADPRTATCQATIAAQLGQVDRNYDVILSALRAAAGPDTTIAVMTYYNPLPACRLAALTPLAQLVLEGGGPVRAGLNDIIRSRAQQHGAVVVETAPLIGPEDLVGGTDCLHPDNSGHADIAGAFASAVDDVTGPPGRR